MPRFSDARARRVETMDSAVEISSPGRHARTAAEAVLILTNPGIEFHSTSEFKTGQEKLLGAK